MRIDRLVLLCGLAAALAGCQSTRSSGPATPLTPAPTTPVATASLPPVEPADDGLRGATDADDSATEPATQVASAEIQPPPDAADISKSDMSGGWTLTSSGSTCMLNMSQTSWEGGQRALTRGCTVTPLDTVSAWQLNGKQLVLVAGGDPVARLYRVGDTQFSGQTISGGKAVRIFR